MASTSNAGAGEDEYASGESEYKTPMNSFHISTVTSMAPTSNAGAGEDEYPSGEFEYKTPRKSLAASLRTLIAYPWLTVRDGRVLFIPLHGQISDQLNSWFSCALSLPKLCENLIKAAYDPRICDVYLHVESLNCGWGKVEEIRRHLLDFKKSGKFIIGYAPVWQEKEYYIGCACNELYAPPSAYFSLYGLIAEAQFCGGVFEKLGVEPQVKRIGKYKSAGDQLTRKNMSKENREVLTTMIDNIYENWVDKVSKDKGKSKEEIESFINEGVYQIEKLKEDGWITDIKYEDQVSSMLRTRLGTGKKKLYMNYQIYSKVSKWSVGLSGGKDRIAVIRASGSISRGLGSGINTDKISKKIRHVGASNKYKALIIRIDSPGGDALASDLIWREIKLLAESKPVVASMVDVAASGGYYMAMAAGTIVSENLTLTGSIGVVTGKYNFGKLFERIGFNKEIVSRGRFAELNAADQRPFRPDEEKLFAAYAQNAYEQFRNKAALSRSMSVDEMEKVAQGRVWTGNDAASRGLVDTIGGFSRAVAIAKHKANIPQNKKVTLVEMSKSSFSLQQTFFNMMSSAIGIDTALKHVQNDFAMCGEVQARMEGIKLNGSEGSSFGLLKDYLTSL